METRDNTPEVQIGQPSEPAPFDIEARLKAIPQAPGVYIMKDRKGEIIYVGKSINLKARVRSYFRGGDTRSFVKRLPRLLGDIETIVTGNEFQALRLEASLIRGHRPKFNVALMNDSLWLRIDPRVPWPTVDVVREVANDGARYFGEYPSGGAARRSTELLTRHFMLRTCSDAEMARRDRPCLQYQIKRCLAPCVLEVERAEYLDRVNESILFLEGSYPELRQLLERRMVEASDMLAYEVAARFRDQLRAVVAALERYKIVSTEEADCDAFGFYREGERMTIQVLSVRKGRLMHTRAFPFEDQEFPDDEVMSSFLNLYYSEGRSIPAEVLLPCWIEAQELLAGWLSKIAGRRVVILTPTRAGERRDLVHMANQNAGHTFRQQHDEGDHRRELLDKLQRRLGLSKIPKRIECFDISNLQNEALVGAMVVFVDSVVSKRDRRHFKIKEVEGQDDFASMREVIRRRFERGLKGDWPMPDLVIIDGGKGQLGVAHQVMEDLGVKGVDLIALAKSRAIKDGKSDKVHHSLERVFLPGRKNPIILQQNSAELFLLQRIRDEAHETALSYHRQVRRKKSLQGSIERIPGVGPKRHKALMRHFGSLGALKRASREDLQKVAGISRQLAEAIMAALGGAAPQDPRQRELL